MIDNQLAVQAPSEVIQLARDALHEIEREVIMLQMTFVGANRQEIIDVPFVGPLTKLNSARDLMFMANLRAGIKRLDVLLSKEESYITLKRLKAIRQHFNVMVHQNQNASSCRTTSAWNIKSAKFIAGELLAGVFNKHLPRNLFVPTATPI